MNAASKDSPKTGLYMCTRNCYLGVQCTAFQCIKTTMQLRHRSIIRVRSQNLGQDSIRLGFRNPELLLDNPVVVPWKVRNRKGQILQRHGGIPPIAISFDWKSLQIMHVRLPHAQYWPHVRCCTFSVFFDGLCFHDFHGVFTVIGYFFTVKSRIFTLTDFIKFWPS